MNVTPNTVGNYLLWYGKDSFFKITFQYKNQCKTIIGKIRHYDDLHGTFTVIYENDKKELTELKLSFLYLSNIEHYIPSTIPEDTHKRY